jgi:hypothetical protein
MRVSAYEAKTSGNFQMCINLQKRSSRVAEKMNVLANQPSALTFSYIRRH